MDSLTPSSGNEGGAEEQAAVQSIGPEINSSLELNSSDEGNESGAGALNPIKKLEIMSSTVVSSEDGAGLPKVPVFKEPKAMGPPPSMPPPFMPPPSMPPPKITKSNLPGPMGPPPMRVKQSKEEAKEPVEGSAAEGTLLSCSSQTANFGCRCYEFSLVEDF